MNLALVEMSMITKSMGMLAPSVWSFFIITFAIIFIALNPLNKLVASLNILHYCLSSFSVTYVFSLKE